VSGAGDGKSLVLSAIDIVQLIGQSVKLTRRGKDYVGLCPFHQEKTPSFNVVPGKQIFHCFGCKATGNAIDFVIKRDRIEFREALQLLAQQAGIELPRSEGQKRVAGERQSLLEAISAAAGLFEKWFHHPQTGAAARAYVQKRGFTAESIRRFNIGFAPDAWDSIASSLSRKFPPALLAQAGLIKPRESGGGHYDVFRNRLMFPIRDETGRTIAFGGRIMPGPESEKTAKYLNSPETPLFHKGRAVFGLDLAKQKVIETRTVAIVEGYTDVIMAHQYGASNVVSILGTAMTENHVALLRRFADKIVLLFDADAAGDAAVNRTVELFLTQPVEIGIATIPDGLDPDEYLLKHGPESFSELFAGALDALTYKWNQLRAQFASAGGLTGQQKAVSAYLELLSSARSAGPVDPLRWGMALNQVGKLTGIPVDELHRRFGSRSARPLQRPQQVRRTAAGVTDVAQGPADESPTKQSRPVPSGPLSARDRAERWILGAVLREPARWDELQQELQPQDFTEDSRQRLAELFWDVARHDGHVELNELLSLMGDDDGMKALAVTLVQEVEELSDAEQVVSSAVQHIRRSRERVEESRHLAQLTGSGGSGASSSTEQVDEVALLRQLEERVRRRACGGN
jgi:DNA primase